MKSVPEGSTFLVDWKDVDRRDAPPGLLVVARRAPRTAVIAAYVFEHAPAGAVEGLPFQLPTPASAAGRARMAAMPMIQGEWRSLGIHADFQREQWRFDEVAWRPLGGRQWIAIRLDDRNVLTEISQREIDDHEAHSLPSGDLMSNDWPATLLARLAQDRVRRELDDH